MRASKPTIAVTLASPVLLAVAILALAAGNAVGSAFPGANGRIAFASNQDGSWDIYTMDPDGGRQTRLTNDPAADTQPSFSPDGAQIAFASDRGGNWDVYKMNADGSGLTRLTTDPGVDTQPSFSPDGARIAFVGKRGTSWYGDVYLMNADGSDQVRLIEKGGQEDTPTFSPDGQRIAFGRGDAGHKQIFTMNASGGELTALTGNPASDRQPTFSPDGQRIAFSSRREGRAGIFSMRSDGSGVTMLTGKSSSMPAYAPDGQSIAFVRGGSIFTMSANGGGEAQLTKGHGSQAWPSWQPLVGGAAGGASHGGPKTLGRLRIGRPILNRRRGIAMLPVTVPGAGALRLRGRRVKPTPHPRPVAGRVTVKLPVKPRRRPRAKLMRRGSVKVKVLVTYSRKGGAVETRAKTFKLRMRRHRR